jgi:hypothetical protein
MAQVITRLTRDEAYEMLEDRIWELDEHDNVGVLVDILRRGATNKAWLWMSNAELSDEMNKYFSDTTYEVIDLFQMEPPTL